jgi:hypothetical protein
MPKDLCIRENYKDRNGNDKVSWHKVGVLIDGKEGKQYVKLFHMPGTLISVFTPKPKEEVAPANNEESIEL